MEKFGHGALGDELALGEDGHAVADLFDLVEEVAGEEDGAVSVAEATDKFSDFDHALRVEAVCGFVEEDQVRVAEEGVRQAEALFHAHGVGVEPRAGAVCEADLV